MDSGWQTVGNSTLPHYCQSPTNQDLVEHFHRHLKSALHAQLLRPNWQDELPWVLLGIRTAPKEDLGTSSAELVYGSPLMVRGNFLISTLSWLQPTILSSRHFGKKSKISHQFHLQAIILPWLQCPPISRQALSFSCGKMHISCHYKSHIIWILTMYWCLATRLILNMGGRQEVVSIDRLKPAHWDIDCPVQVAIPP